MVHESTMICFDNSEYMRNGDFVPTRLQAQQDAANLVLQCKLRSNPENGVGVVAMGGKVDVLSTLTQDSSKLFMKLHQVQLKSTCLFSASIRVAHLALKHRQNRNHKPRVVLFVGSPMEAESTDELIKLAKKLKKEKVSVDVICFGESDTDNAEKMTQFVDTLNGKDGTSCHLVVVPSGAPLTDALVSSPICRGEDGSAAPVALAGVGGAMDDLSEDPELAMALRVSLEDQRLRQEREAREVADESAQEAGVATPAAAAPTGDVNLDAMTEEEQLAMALRMSMDGAGAGSMEVDEPPTEETQGGQDDDMEALISDPNILQDMISNLPGVQSTDELLQQIQENTAETKKEAAAKKTLDGEKKSGKKDDQGGSSSTK